MIRIEDFDTPVKAAQKIIHGTKQVEMTPLRKMANTLATGKTPQDDQLHEEDMFSDVEIREIADYLLTYCKYHGGSSDETE